MVLKGFWCDLGCGVLCKVFSCEDLFRVHTPCADDFFEGFDFAQLGSGFDADAGCCVDVS